MLFLMHVIHFPLRLSTCSPAKGRWFQSVPRHTFYSCKSGPQRSSYQNCVRAYGPRQRQGVTLIWTRWWAECSDDTRLWRKKLWMWRERGYHYCCCCCCLQPVSQSISQVVQFMHSHFTMQEERCCLSEMKKSSASQIHCKSNQCWGPWKQGTGDWGSWNTEIADT